MQNEISKLQQKINQLELENTSLLGKISRLQVFEFNYNVVNDLCNRQQELIASQLQTIQSLQIMLKPVFSASPIKMQNDGSNGYTSLEELVEALDYGQLRNLPHSAEWASLSYELERLLHNGELEELIKTILFRCIKYQVGH